MCWYRTLRYQVLGTGTLRHMLQFSKRTHPSQTDDENQKNEWKMAFGKGKWQEQQHPSCSPMPIRGPDWGCSLVRCTSSEVLFSDDAQIRSFEDSIAKKSEYPIPKRQHTLDFAISITQIHKDESRPTTEKKESKRMPKGRRPLDHMIGSSSLPSSATITSQMPNTRQQKERPEWSGILSLSSLVTRHKTPELIMSKTKEERQQRETPRSQSSLDNIASSIVNITLNLNNTIQDAVKHASGQGTRSSNLSDSDQDDEFEKLCMCPSNRVCMCYCTPRSDS